MANSLGRIKSVAAAICLMLVLACAGAGPTEPPQPETLAIWDLEDLSVSPRAHAGMGELLAGQIASRLGQTGQYKVVERQQLIKALEELHIGSSELADAQTRLRLGGMLGARQMVFGAFQAVGPMLRLDLRLVDVASGRILSTATATANIQDIGGWLQAAERAAGDLVQP
jgi:TolB-like protein